MSFTLTNFITSWPGLMAIFNCYVTPYCYSAILHSMFKCTYYTVYVYIVQDITQLNLVYLFNSTWFTQGQNTKVQSYYHAVV